MTRPETYDTADTNPDTGLPLDIGYHDLEGKGSALKDDGFFDKGILQALEVEHNARGNTKEVKVIGNGHQHGNDSSSFSVNTNSTFISVTDNCRRIRGVWLCFGGGGYVSIIPFAMIDILSYLLSGPTLVMEG